MTDANARPTADASQLQDESFPVEVTESSVVYAGHVWDVRSDTFLYNGHPTTRDYIDHPGAVAVVAVDEAQNVLLIQQYRHPLRQRNWEIPAGLLDVEGEEPVETAKRELAEEVDLVASTWDHLATIRTSPGGSDETVHLFLARGLAAAPEVHAREAEEADIRVEWVPLADAVAGVLGGRLHNAILALGVLGAAERLRGA